MENLIPKSKINLFLNDETDINKIERSSKEKKYSLTQNLSYGEDQYHNDKETNYLKELFNKYSNIEKKSEPENSLLGTK